MDYDHKKCQRSRRAENFPIFIFSILFRLEKAFFLCCKPISPLIVHFQMDDDEPPSSIWMTNECTSRLRGKYLPQKDKTFLLLYQTSIMNWWNLTIAGINENFIRKRSNRSEERTNEWMTHEWEMITTELFFIYIDPTEVSLPHSRSLCLSWKPPHFEN